jgi:hypothetical protein
LRRHTYFCSDTRGRPAKRQGQSPCGREDSSPHCKAKVVTLLRGGHRYQLCPKRLRKARTSILCNRCKRCKLLHAAVAAPLALHYWPAFPQVSHAHPLPCKCIFGRPFEQGATWRGRMCGQLWCGGWPLWCSVGATVGVRCGVATWCLASKKAAQIPEVAAVGRPGRPKAAGRPKAIEAATLVAGSTPDPCCPAG